MVKVTFPAFLVFFLFCFVFIVFLTVWNDFTEISELYEFSTFSFCFPHALYWTALPEAQTASTRCSLWESFSSILSLSPEEEGQDLDLYRHLLLPGTEPVWHFASSPHLNLIIALWGGRCYPCVLDKKTKAQRNQKTSTGSHSWDSNPTFQRQAWGRPVTILVQHCPAPVNQIWR